MKGDYLHRIADRVLDEALKASGAVLIEGPKWCGKTRTAAEKAASVLYMQDPDRTESLLKMADTKPSLLLQGKTPRLLDEWQMAPVLWDAVRHAVDMRGETGQFILTGSAVPSDNAARHSGTGRISRMLMRPMSLFESLESSGDVSLQALFDGAQDVEGASTLTIKRIAFVMARGGWPASIGEDESIALRRVYDYVDAVINVDVSRVDGVEKSPARVRALMRSLARNVSTSATLATIRADIAGDEDSISEKTVSSHLNALRRIFVVEDLPAWNPAMRSKTAIRTSPKRHFVDPSVAAAVLRAAPDGLLEDFKTFGFLFESLCVRDLRVYGSPLGAEVSHYRDKTGLEADAILTLPDGRWGAFEVKLGARQEDEAARNLLAVAARIDAERSGAPAFLAILTAGSHALRRADGVYVIPAGCLGP